MSRKQSARKLSARKQLKTPTPAQRLGLRRLEKLTVKACQKRAKFLRESLEREAYKGADAELARRWSYWYASKARQLKAS